MEKIEVNEINSVINNNNENKYTCENLNVKAYLTDELLNPLLTDFYQFTMIYAYWKYKRHTEIASFDLFFRKNPYKAHVSTK